MLAVPTICLAKTVDRVVLLLWCPLVPSTRSWVTSPVFTRPFRFNNSLSTTKVVVLALGKAPSEVWKVLAAVKTEFGRFGDVLSKVKKKIDEASSQIEQTEIRTRAIGRKLREVEALPSDEVAKLIEQETNESGPTA